VACGVHFDLCLFFPVLFFVPPCTVVQV
jgi:hypothetical protein